MILIKLQGYNFFFMIAISKSVQNTAISALLENFHYELIYSIDIL